jgi:hypothetical protein
MAKAEANRFGLYAHEETNWNETPSTPIMTEIPITGEGLKHNKETVSDPTIRADGNIDGHTEVGVSGDGDINFVLRHADYQNLLTSSIRNTPSTESKTGAGTSNNFAFAAAGAGVQVITGPATWTDNFVVGAWVRVASAAQALNNGVFKVTAKTSTTLTVANTTGVSETNSVAVITQKMTRNGVLLRSWLLEKRFLDISKFQYFPGMRVGGAQLQVQSKAQVTGSFTFLGAQGIPSATTIGNASSTAKSTDKVINASSNVGQLTENGVAMSAIVKAFSLTINSNLRSQDVIGSKFPGGIGAGSVAVEGQIEVYFQDIALMQKDYDHTQTSFSIRLTDPAGKVMIITLPALELSEGSPIAGGKDTDVMAAYKMNCHYDPTTACTIQFDFV